MSTIKSSDEHLTLNADGSSKDIKFQANGVEKASISSAGAFTSTTIDATALTGNLPALNASALTNLDAADVSGTHTNFTSTGIDDNATSTAITIDASENVGIGAAPESGTSGDVSELDMGLMSLSIWKGESQPNDSASYGYNCYKTSGFTYKAKKSSSSNDWKPSVYEQAYGTHKFRVATTATADAAISWTNALEITNDGRGLSQFTAKAWVNFNGSGTLAVNDSHNVSSVTDHETGNYSVNFSNNMANANFSSTITAGNQETTQTDSYMVASLYDTASGQSVSKQKFRTLRLKTGFAFQDPKTVCATFFGD